MIEIVLLAVLGPLALFPTPARFAALLAIPALWIWRRARGGSGFIPRTPLDWPIVCLLGMVLVSVYATDDLSLSLPKIAGVVYGVEVYYGVVNACRRGGASSLWAGVAALILAGGGIALLALAGTNWTNKFAALEWLQGLLPARLTGLPGAETGFQPNEVAGALVWIIPLALALGVGLLRRGSRPPGTPRWLLLLVGLGALGLGLVLLLTESRGALLGLAVSIGAMLFVGLRRYRLPLLVAGALVVAVAALAVIALGAEDTLRLAVGLGRAEGQSASLDTVEGRLETWNRALDGIQDFPFTGMGMNRFRLLVHLLYPMYLVAPDVDIGHAHNLWLQAALDVGLPGLVAYLALWVGAGAMLISTYRQAAGRPRPEFRLPSFAPEIALGLGGGLLAHFVFGLTDAIALGAKPGVLWWAMLGLINGLYYQNRIARNNG